MHDDGEALPRLVPRGRRFLVRNIYSDLKRHELGPAFYEREYNGTHVTRFVTEPLWGVATTAPYGHDGRSINLEDVILRHGGEAEASRDAFAALGDDNRRKILEFLDTLILFPPDDTASNLNPGVPGTADLQDPAQRQEGSKWARPGLRMPSRGGFWPRLVQLQRGLAPVVPSDCLFAPLLQCESGFDDVRVALGGT